MFEIIPAIDIIDGRCVRLTQGDYSTVRRYDALPLDMALRFRDLGFGRLHLVDLDGAKAGRPENLRTLELIATHADGLVLEWGGGLKTDGDLTSAFSAGMSQAVIGSVAVREPDKMSRWLSTFTPARIILGADVRGNKAAVSGWEQTSSDTVDDLLDRYIPSGLDQAIVTQISRDGMLRGPDFDLYTSLRDRYTGVTFCVSGGIGSIADIEKALNLGLQRVIVGKAIYEGLIDLRQLSTLSQQCSQKE